MKAPVGRRIIAYFIDGFIAGLLLLLFSAAGFVVEARVDSVFGKLLALFLFLLAVVFYAGFILVKDGFFSGCGIGKKLMRLRVVRSDGSRCDFESSALRNVTFLIPPVNLLELVIAVVDAEGRRLGDKIAKTQVVE